MNKSKENAIRDYLGVIAQSWTWGKLTKEERECFEEFVLCHTMVENAAKGTYKQRWDVLGAIYYSFLLGCGYRNQTDWRD